MPTQMPSRAEIVRRWGPLLSGFEPAPPGHPIAGGMPAGAVTDDTEQAVLLGRLLVEGRGMIDPRSSETTPRGNHGDSSTPVAWLSFMARDSKRSATVLRTG